MFAQPVEIMFSDDTYSPRAKVHCVANLCLFVVVVVVVVVVAAAAVVVVVVVVRLFQCGVFGCRFLSGGMCVHPFGVAPPPARYTREEV